MRYITQVAITGFQSHEKTVITFGPGVNAITGPSDNGKSAVLRAIKWALWNQAPDDFIRLGCTLTQAEVTFDDGTVILRERAGKRNKYVVTVPGKNALELVDFGTKVPSDVINAHGMRPIQFKPKKNSYLNFAGQLEEPFFLADGPTERADILGRLAGVQVIDRAMDAADREKRALSSEIKTLDEQATRIDAELTTYANLDERERRVGEAERILANLGSLNARLGRLQALRGLWVTVQQGQMETGATLDRLKMLDAASARLAEAENAHLRVRPLTSAKTTWIQVQTELATTSATLERLQHTDEAAQLLSCAELAHARIRPLTSVRSAWQQITQQMQATELALSRLENVSDAEKALQSAETASKTVLDMERVRATRDEVRRLWKPTKVILAQTEGIPEADHRLASALDTQGRLQRFYPLQTTWHWLQVEMETVRRALDATSRLPEATTAFELAAAVHNRIALLHSLRGRHGENSDAQEKVEGLLGDLNQQIQDTGVEYAQALQDAGVCPTCFQMISPETATQIASDSTKEEVHAHVC